MEYGVSGNSNYLQAKQMWQIKKINVTQLNKQKKSHNLSSL